MKVKVLVLLFLVSFGTHAQDFSKLDNYFELLNGKFNGSVAISKDNKVVYKRALGFRDIDGNLKADTDTKYGVGSISKTFTSVLTFMAIEQNLLSLDTPLNRFYPNIKNADRITVSHLLGHRSGIFNYTNSPGYFFYYTGPKTKEEMVVLLERGGTVFEPNEKAEYSNSNYLLLTYILEDVFKMPFAELLEQKIAKPLGLKRTYLGTKADMARNESYSYVYTAYEGKEFFKKEPETHVSVPMGAGGVGSTPSDLVLFADGLFSGKLISAASLEKMKTITDNYGMGLFRAIKQNGVVGYGHDGGIDGFMSFFLHFPDKGISVAGISNGTSYSLREISETVYSSALGNDYNLPDFSSAVLRIEELDKYMGNYVSDAIPIKIAVTKNGTRLVAQATGQQALQLTTKPNHTFAYDAAGIVMVFSPNENTMLLKQGGKEYRFKKQM